MQFNIADLYESLADVIPDRVAVVCGDTRLTFGALEERGNRLANFFRSRGVKAGDHVGLHMYNGTEFLEAMLALFKLRAVPINFNYRYVANEIRYQVDNADCVAMITQQELQSVLAEAITGMEAIHTVMVLDDDSGAPILDGYVEYETAMKSGSVTRQFEARSENDLYIIYTGGTTGMPKGVMWRHVDVFYAGLQGGAPGDDPIERPEDLAERASDPDYALSMLPTAPFIHGSAQWTAWICLFTGGKLVLQPGRSFDPKRVVQLIEEEELTTISLVGDAMARPIVEVLRTGEYNTDTLVAVASAGAILSPTIRKQLEALLPDTMIMNNFGASETGHQGAAIPGDDTGVEGRPSFFMDETNVVLDDDLTPLEPGSNTLGRLARRGRLPLGYYKDPIKTAERFVESNGVRYVVAGDFAKVEEDGRITIFGRGSVCINTGGEKVFPSEVEETLKAHPDVFDALVVGVSCDQWMQQVAAVIQTRNGTILSLEEIQAHCRAHIAGYKVPRIVRLVDAVERQPSGKPDYKWALNLMES
jgi:acyl-CoA synthetase (AMP-forming)/AMP-acid ligase II